MKNNLPSRVVMTRRGITLLELTVVIGVLIVLLALTFIGAEAWKRGSERSICLLTTRNVQVATRSYQNLYGYEYGGRPYAVDGSQDIAKHLYQKGYIESQLYERVTGSGSCPAGGTYSRPVPDVFPELGHLYVVCSLSESEEHVPEEHFDW